MRVYISADTEGVAGVVTNDQTHPEGDDYQRFRRLMTQEVNAAVEACAAEGATDVVVDDAHGTMTHLLVEDLHPAARLLTGATKLLGQMEAIDACFDACFLLGYHQREGGGDGVLNHTIHGKVVHEVRVNGEAVGELELSAWLAGRFGVPVALISGDDALCADAEERIPGVVTAPVKEAIDRFCVLTLAAPAAPLAPPPAPVALEVDFERTASAHAALLIPGVDRSGPHTATFACDDYATAYRLLTAVVVLGGAAYEGRI